MMAAFTLRVVWALLALCLPVLIHAADVSRFVSEEEQAYLEVQVDGRLQKIYTEHHGDYKALFVLGEKNNPELLQFSFHDGSKRIATWVLEFRSEKGVVSPGVAVAGNEFLKSLHSDAKGFPEWQTRFASFPDEPTERAVLTDRAFADPIGIEIFEGEQIAFRMGNWVCRCRPGTANLGCILPSAVLCAMNELCTVFECIREGDWSPSCHDALQRAKVCLGMLEE